MYTQCPECHTVFSLTADDLTARGGLVRCGRCTAIFRADHYLREHPAAPSTPPAAATPAIEGDVTDTAPTDPVADVRIPTVASMSDTTAPKRRTGWIWGLGNVLLLCLLTVQYVYAYRPDLLRHPEIQPWVNKICEIARCRMAPMQDLERIELVEAEVLPHPKYEQALRVSALLVNRANFVQAFPLLEITLTDHRGQVVARRTFPARQYLQQSSAAAEGMPPQRSIQVLFDLTSPGSHAAGYEIRVVTSAS